jgi:hypothetical protein
MRTEEELDYLETLIPGLAEGYQKSLSGFPESW